MAKPKQWKKQQQLKADKQAKTNELENKCAEMDRFYAEAKKTVKLEMDQRRWKEFGVQDKR